MREEIIKRNAWVFLQQFLPSVVECLHIETFDEYIEIVLTSSIISVTEDIGDNILANRILISYDFYKAEIKEYFNEMGGYYE